MGDLFAASYLLSLEKIDSKGVNLHLKSAIDYFFQARGVIIDKMQEAIDYIDTPDCSYKELSMKLNAVLKTKSKS